MIEKVTGPEQLQKIRSGNMLIRYPLVGEPREKIDLSDTANFMAYRVQDVDAGYVDLLIPEAEGFAAEEIGPVSGLSLRPMIASKSLEELVTERVWWIRQGDIAGTAIT